MMRRNKEVLRHTKRHRTSIVQKGYVMGEYRCEGIGSVNGGTYDKLHIEGVFTAKGPIKANLITGEGVMNFSALSAESLALEGVTNIKGPMEAGSCSMEGVLKADRITITGNFFADGVVGTDFLKAGSATLLFNSKKCGPRPFAKVRSFFSGKDVMDEKNAKIREIEAGTLVIEDYSVQKITGQDITIGRGCIVDTVQADTRLRIHKTAQIKNFGSSAAPEYFD